MRIQHVLFPVAGVMAVAAVLQAGPLDPPSGPVTSMYKTLVEVEPRIAVNATNTPGDGDSTFRISQAGSYYLTGNLAGEPGKAGIEIAADQVTLDLNGFRVQGTGGALAGVRMSGTHFQIVVKNGTVVGWPGGGVHLVPTGFETDCTVVDVIAGSNPGGGIHVPGGSTIRRCTASFNGDAGLVADTGSIIEGCVAVQNVDRGFRPHSISTDSLTILNCISSRNGGNGVECGVSGVVEGTTSTLNGGHGFLAESGAKVVNCHARLNNGSGIVARSGTEILNNLIGSNGDDGVGSGILASGTGARIEGNRCRGNDIGIEITGTSNVIIKNYCTGNGQNWNIGANNLYGPIVNRIGASSSAVVGNGTAAGSLGSTDPNANYTY